MAQYQLNPQSPLIQQRLETVYCNSVFRDNMVRVTKGFQDFSLTAAQMDTLNATPVQVLAAPPSGYLYAIQQVVVTVVPGATPFELGSGVLSFLYTDGSGAKVSADVPNATVESATTTYYVAVAASVVPVVDAKIVAKASADVTAGDGAVYGRIFYQLVKAAELSTTVTVAV